jgi:hypothetical protein
MKLVRWAIAAILLLIQPATAAAEWHEASSERFVIYSDSRSDDLKRFATMLEQFHRAMELETGREVPVPSPSSRVTVFMVGSVENLRDIYGARNSSVGGFYIPRASGSLAFVPNIRVSGSERDQSLSILLHEYAHHFLISSSPHAMPRWLSEGAAEYFSSAKFPPDGAIEIGLPNNQRAWELANAEPVSLIELLDEEAYNQGRSRRYDAFYGRAWLLYHYLRFEPDRKGQLSRYWAEVSNGQSSLKSAETIFGDLDQLEKELKQYNRQRRMAGMRFNSAEIATGAVSVRKLSQGHQAMMPVLIRLRREPKAEQVTELAGKARAIAEKHPDDAEVLAALALAERLAGNPETAASAASRAIALDAGLTHAYGEKGLALWDIARAKEGGPVSFTEAMKPFMALNRMENDHPLPLIYLYRSFVERGAAPSETARHALERAFMLAPFDHGLAFDVALMLAAEGKPDLAAMTLAPVSANPHGGNRAERAGRLRKALLNAEPGKPFDPSAYLLAPASLDEAAGEDGDSE